MPSSGGPPSINPDPNPNPLVWDLQPAVLFGRVPLSNYVLIAKHLWDDYEGTTLEALVLTCRDIYLTVRRYRLKDWHLDAEFLLPWIDQKQLTYKEYYWLAHYFPHFVNANSDVDKWVMPSYTHPEHSRVVISQVLPSFAMSVFNPKTWPRPFPNVKRVVFTAEFMLDIGWYRFKNDQIHTEEIKDLVRRFEHAFAPDIDVCVQIPYVSRTSHPVRHFNLEPESIIRATETEFRQWYKYGQEDVDLAMDTLCEYQNLKCLWIHGVEVGQVVSLYRYGSTIIDFRQLLLERNHPDLAYYYQEARYHTIVELGDSICQLPRAWSGTVSLRNLHLLAHPTAAWDRQWRETSKLAGGADAFLDELARRDSREKIAPNESPSPFLRKMWAQGRLRFECTDTANDLCPCCGKSSDQIGTSLLMLTV